MPFPQLVMWSEIQSAIRRAIGQLKQMHRYLHPCQDCFSSMHQSLYPVIPTLISTLQLKLCYVSPLWHSITHTKSKKPQTWKDADSILLVLTLSLQISKHSATQIEHKTAYCGRLIVNHMPVMSVSQSQFGIVLTTSTNQLFLLFFLDHFYQLCHQITCLHQKKWHQLLTQAPHSL